TQALAVARDPNRDIGDFASIVERDVGLTAQILRIANSATFAPPKPIVSLHLAVVRLGLNHCRNLIIAATVGNLIHKLTAHQQAAREALWQHGFTTAVIA